VSVYGYFQIVRTFLLKLLKIIIIIIRSQLVHSHFGSRSSQDTLGLSLVFPGLALALRLHDGIGPTTPKITNFIQA